jgi:hypothetical protein
MTDRLRFLFSVLLVCLLLPFQASAAGEADEFEGLPPGTGREETFYACSACHSIKLVVQQGLSRSAWKETLQWMVEEQEMEPLEEAEYKLVLDYLATHLNTDHRPAHVKQ